VLAWFGFGRSTLAAQALRGAEDAPPLDVWTMSADGSARQQLTKDGGYRSPVFCPDGRIVAIHGASLRILGGAGGETRPAPSGRALDGLLACKDGKVWVFAADGALLVVDLTSGETRVMEASVDAGSRAVLRGSTRTCKGRMVAEQYPPGLLGWSEIVVHDERGAGPSLTEGLTTRFNREPAFSADCARIAFAAAPAAGAVGVQAPPPQRGCACALHVAPEPPIAGALAAIGLAIALRARRAGRARR
jgi:hypothetical protein